jgi:hypothetical protein
MFKVRQALTLQQNLKYLGLVSRFLQGHQFLNLTEGYQLLDPFLWEYILENSKVSGVLGSWVVWIHEELQLDQFRLVHVRPIHLVRFLHLGNKGMGRGFLCTERGKAAEDLENLLMVIVHIDLAQKLV